MKTERGGFRMLRHEQLMTELVEDSYHQSKKMADGAVCPSCGATFQDGRWTWLPASANAQKHECPACQRIADDYPAGYITLTGPYMAAHHDELVAIARAREAAEKKEHPLQRIMAITAQDGDMLVTTTDSRLAHRIAHAVEQACSGKAEFHYSKGENLLRATWTR